MVEKLVTFYDQPTHICCAITAKYFKSKLKNKIQFSYSLPAMQNISLNLKEKLISGQQRIIKNQSSNTFKNTCAINTCYGEDSLVFTLWKSHVFWIYERCLFSNVWMSWLYNCWDFCPEKKMLNHNKWHHAWDREEGVWWSFPSSALRSQNPYLRK